MTKQRLRNSKRCLEVMNTLEEDIASLDGVHNSNIKVKKWFIPPYDVVWEEKPFSKGSFESVHRGEWRDTPVVVKRLLSECDDTTEHQFLKKIEIWHSLKYEHIIRFYDAFHVGELFFVCEYAPHGTLPEFLRKPENEHLKWKKKYEMVVGLHYLRKKGVIYGDLKGNKFLVDADGKAKAADSGLNHVVVTSASIKSTTGNGAVQWKAPEILINRGKCPISFESDVYSFAMCIIVAITGDFPWRKDIPDVAVIYHAKEDKLPDMGEHFSKEQW